MRDDEFYDGMVANQILKEKETASNRLLHIP